MTNKEKLALLENLLEIEGLKPEDKLEYIEDWDSMTRLSLMVMVKNKFGKIITNEDMKNYKTVQDILNVMEADQPQP